MAYVRRCQKLSVCQTETVPDAYKMDPLLVKAKPVSLVRSVSATAYLRKQQQLRE